MKQISKSEKAKDGNQLSYDPISHIDEMCKEENINEKVNFFVGLLKQFDLLNLMKQLVLAKYKVKKDKRKSKHDFELLGIQLKYIQAIYCGLKFNDSTRKVTSDELTYLLTKGSEAIHLASMHASHSNLKEEDDDFLFNAKLYEICDGKTYMCFAPFMLINLMIPQESVLKKAYGMTAEEFAQGAEKLISIWAEISESLVKSKAKNEIDEILPDKFFSVKEITNWPQQLIDDLSFENGEEKAFFGRDKYRGWCNVEMPTIQKPFVKINGTSYMFDSIISFDHIYRSIQKAVCSKNDTYKIEWNENQQLASEKLSASLIQKLFQEKPCYTNNFFEETKGHWVENDGLLLYENSLIVFEVKGGSYTPRSADLDPESHKRAVKALIDKPLSQCDRLIAALNKNNVLEICDDRHKRKIILERDKVDLVIPLAISLDPIGELTTYIQSEENNERLPISLYDLTIYAFFFESPLFFLHFLKERIKPIKIDKLMNSDEMNYLGSYISNRHFNYRFNNLDKEFEHDGSTIGTVWIEDMHGDIDHYFDSFMQTEKPKFDVSALINDIILCLDKNEGADRVKLALNMLDADKCVDNNLDDVVAKIVQRQKQTNKFASVTVHFHDNTVFTPIQVFCNTETEKHATEQKAFDYSVAMLEAMNIEEIFYLILEIDKSKIVDVKFKLVTKVDKIRVTSRDYQFYVEHIKSTSTSFNFHNNNPIRKIGRNELCPCGSGKKFKHCCGK